MFTSYAQAREDVLLCRALRSVPHQVGFYIDIGAYDPDDDSVTKLFYEHGWRGVNVEPSPELFERFERVRQRDINLRAAVTDVAEGEIRFYANDGQLGTVESKFADRGGDTHSYLVPRTTLTEICRRYAPPDIHFLKIDVEGHEGAVIRGMDFGRYRPWILVIEATEPNRLDRPTFHEWDEAVLQAGYLFVYTDVLNRYYVAEERPELAVHFSVPADDYILARHLREIEGLRREVADLKDRLSNTLSPA